MKRNDSAWVDKVVHLFKFLSKIFLYKGKPKEVMAKIKAYAPIQKTLEERLEYINGGGELWLAIEGRYTNLRIWKSRLHAPINPDNTMGIFMRLDRVNQYSAPLSEETVSYIENKKSPIYQLAKFSFPTSVDNLQEILEITKSLIIRNEIIEW